MTPHTPHTLLNLNQLYMTLHLTAGGLLHKTTREESETYGDPPKEIASHDKVYNEQKVLK